MQDGRKKGMLLLSRLNIIEKTSSTPEGLSVSLFGRGREFFVCWGIVGWWAGGLVD